MRLDALDKAPVVSATDGLAEDFSKVVPKNITAEIKPSAEADSDAAGGGQPQARLAKIINLIDEAQKRKAALAQQHQQKVGREQAHAAYRRIQLGFTGDALGESLDKKA